MNLDIKKLGIAIFTPFFAGGIGSYFTYPSIQGWYATLNKPFFNPPNWIFGPVWTFLYLLMGIASYLIWMKPASKKRAVAIRWYVIQLVLNTIWSLLFFGLQSPFLAFVEVLFFWLTILLTIRSFYGLSRTAALILIPYLMWVSFASILTFFILILNK
jgi:tryptophan-rich sensory protein